MREKEEYSYWSLIFTTKRITLSVPYRYILGMENSLSTHPSYESLILVINITQVFYLEMSPSIISTFY
jgi:hypothetical protein